MIFFVLVEKIITIGSERAQWRWENNNYLYAVWLVSKYDDINKQLK
jgi:hypothetical protein